MAVKPMLAKAPVVRAMLAGLQTQDRRPVKNQPYRHNRFALERVGLHVGALESFHAKGLWEDKNLTMAPYQIGDTIWVRETLVNEPETESFETADTGCVNCGVAYGRDSCTVDCWKYSADKEYLDDIYDPAWKPSRLTVPSIHMPKWACRLFLKVNAVRLERVREISEADAWAEGIEEYDGYFDSFVLAQFAKELGLTADDPRVTFCCLWKNLYEGSWEKNEWVWVYEFERTDKPADWPGN